MALGDLLCRRFYRFISIPHSWAAAILIGVLLSTKLRLASEQFHPAATELAHLRLLDMNVIDVRDCSDHMVKSDGLTT